MHSKTLIRILLLAPALSTTIFPSHAQDTTRIALPDTTQNKVVHITPYYSQELRTSGSYIKKIDDPDLLEFSAGVSAFNALRGQVPGLYMPAYFSYAHLAGIRMGTYQPIRDALVIIDGVPFNHSIGDYMNLNAFEYSSISAISNTNAVSFLGGANSGAFILNSKTGEGIEKPLLEFNSSASQGWEEAINPQTGQLDKLSEWYLSNTLAYSRDFGAVDMRVSYNILANPNDYRGYTPAYHNLRINTGFQVTPKLNARLVLDGRYHGYSHELTRSGSTADFQKGKQQFLQGNLIFRYQVLDWLHISSQLVYSTRDSTNRREITQQQRILERNMDDDRQLANVFINLQKKLSNNFSLSAFTGVQFIKQNRNLLLVSTDNISTITFNDDVVQRSPHIVLGASVTYKQILDLAFNGRMAKYSLLDITDSRKLNHNIASSFHFTQLWKPAFLAFGKLRASGGSHYVVPFSNYPVEVNYSSLQFSTNKPYKINNVEGGGDFGFLNSKLVMSVNYFTSQEQYDVQNIFNAIESYFRRGWEADVRYWLVKKSNTTFQSGLMFAQVSSKVSLNGIPTNGGYGNPVQFIRWFNQLNLKNIFVTALIESAHSAGSIGFPETSFTKLRDISLGYRFPELSISNLGLERATLSVSGRNLVKLGGSGVDVEETLSPTPFQKSISINLNLVF